MNIQVRPVDIAQDRDLLISTLRQYLTPLSNQRRFDWLYHQNPHGIGRAWIATDVSSGQTIGASAAFPRRVCLSGTERTGWVLGDFCVADQYRSLGPALQLQRATLEGVQRGGSEFCYDFPSRPMVAIYKRLGMHSASRMVRLAKPLRLDRRLQTLNGPAVLTRPVAGLGNLLLRLSDLRLGSAGAKMEIHRGECGKEFTSIWNRTEANRGSGVQRTAEYLNWRYLRHPEMKFQILTARKGGVLQGYLVFSRNGENAEITDWFAPEQPKLLVGMIGELVRRMRRERVITLSAFVQEADPQLPLLKAMGFWPRETSAVMLMGLPAEVQQNWFLMYGDRDS